MFLFDTPAGLLDEGDGYEDPGAQEDEGQQKDHLRYGYDDHWGAEGHTEQTSNQLHMFSVCIIFFKYLCTEIDYQSATKV